MDGRASQVDEPVRDRQSVCNRQDLVTITNLNQLVQEDKELGYDAIVGRNAAVSLLVGGLELEYYVVELQKGQRNWCGRAEQSRRP